MDDVEMRRRLDHLLEHGDLVGDGIAAAAVEAERARRAGMQPGARLRIAAGEERHRMAELDQLFGEIGDDALGAAIEPRRDALDQRRDLGDPHGPHVPAMAWRAGLATASTRRIVPDKVAMSAGLNISKAPPLFQG